jgi:hypothetical protein
MPLLARSSTSRATARASSAFTRTVVERSAINGSSRPPLAPTSAARARGRSSRRATPSTGCRRSLSARVDSRPRPDEAPVTTAPRDLGSCLIESDCGPFGRVVVALLDAPKSGAARLRQAIISPYRLDWDGPLRVGANPKHAPKLSL